MAEILDQASGTAVHAGEFPNECRQAWAIAGLMRAGYLGFEGLATAATGALMQNEMMDIHLDRRQLNDLMRVVRCHRHQLAVAAGTGAGLDQVDLSRAEQRWPFAPVALLPAAFA